MAAILELSTIEIDQSLLERVPLSLCQYHQVLPLAREGACVSAAMVYPHNAAAVAMLAELLDARIVPVQTTAAALQAAFEQLALRTIEPPRILLQATGADPDALLVRLAETLAMQENTECARLASADVGAAATLAAASATRCRLVALPLAAPSEWSDVVLQATASVLLAVSDHAPLTRLLVVLRGHGADLRALAWCAAVAHSESAALTLLVLTEAQHYDLHELLDPETEAGRHVADAIKVVMAQHIEPTLRIRQGDPIQQIVEELTGRRYDMFVLCAEQRGEFASAAMRQLQTLDLNLRALLICKPNRATAAPRASQTTKRRLQRA